MSGQKIIDGLSEALAVERGEQKPAGIYRYCPHDLLDAAIALGWRKAADLHQPHGTFSVLVKWEGDGEIKWPEEKA